jgi:hypothetical protein
VNLLSFSFFGSKIWYHTNSYVCTFYRGKERQGMDRREKDELKPDRPAKISSPSINLFLILDQINTCIIGGNLQTKPKREKMSGRGFGGRSPGRGGRGRGSPGGRGGRGGGGRYVSDFIIDVCLMDINDMMDGC